MLDTTLTWDTDGLHLEARPATAELARLHAAQLASWFNHPHNKELMGNSVDFSAEDVADHYAAQRDQGGLAFLLFVDGAVAGDADLRNIADGSAEFAIMVGDTACQGRGLGTRFTVMVHVHAFRDLRLESVVLSIVPQNHGGRRCYQKAGYVEERSPRALAACDDATDVPMALRAPALRARFPLAWDQVTCT